jgi:hypothetical protein
MFLKQAMAKHQHAPQGMDGGGDEFLGRLFFGRTRAKEFVEMIVYACLQDHDKPISGSESDTGIGTDAIAFVTIPFKKSAGIKKLNVSNHQGCVLG